MLELSSLPAWYAFRDARARRRAVQWLADNSLIDVARGAHPCRIRVSVRDRSGKPRQPAGYWSRPARAGSYRSGLEIRIRNLARRWGASSPGQKRSGVFRELVIRVWA